MKSYNPIVHFRLEQDHLDELQRLADRLKITRSRLIRNFIKNGIDDLHFSENLGIVSLVAFLRKQKVNPEEIFDFIVEKKLEASR